MTCDCNCHYGCNESKCKNCNCGHRELCPTCGQFVGKLLDARAKLMFDGPTKENSL